MTVKTERTGFEVAVIGMAGSFPGARNLDEFWQNLVSGHNSISHFSQEELLEAGVSPEHFKHPHYVAAKGVFPDAEFFDADFFGYTPADAAIMDPQVRLMHQGVYHALEDAGYAVGGNRNIGLFAGASGNFNWELDSFLQTAQSSATQFATLQLNDKDFIATRLAYKLDLRGPAVALHSACSTSLLSIDLACRHLYTGSCGMAVAAGIGLSLPLKNGYGYEEGMIHSANGSCHAFSDDANGTVEGNGMAAVVLKPLEDATADGDSIYAIIRGTGVNNDGERKVGYSAPSVEGQAEVIRRALFMAEVEAETVTYLEAHGTGTNLGDPVEVEALKKAFRSEKKGYCGLGSLKSNIGHTDVAAGISSFIKTTLSLQHQLIPASINITRPNSKIGLEDSPFYLVTSTHPWQRISSPEEPDLELPLRAGVSSFGIGGTNVHVILEEAPETEESDVDESWQCLTFSAKDIDGLTRIGRQMAAWLESNDEVNTADLAYTWQHCRSHLPWRQAITFDSLASLRHALDDPAQAPDLNAVKSMRQPRCVFLFPGQGTQYPGMARELYQETPQFAAHLEQCLSICDRLGSTEIRKILLNPDSDSGQLLEHTSFTQLALFVVEYSLAKLLQGMGLKPIAMLGHSLGEYVAACIAGVFSLEDALLLVQQRAKLMQTMHKGAMLGVSASEQSLRGKMPITLDIAAVNSQNHCTVAGPDADIEAFKELLEADGIQAKILRTSHAFHSAMMEPMLESFSKVLKGCVLHAPQLPYFSNVSGKLITSEEATSVDYYSRHIRQTVLFSNAAESLVEDPEVVFVEVGPGTVLSSLLKQSATVPLLTASVLRSANQQEPDSQFLLNAVGRLWSHGLAIDWTHLHAGQRRQKLRLPLYPFNKKPVNTGRGDVMRLLTQLTETTLPASSIEKRSENATYSYEWRQGLLQGVGVKDDVTPCLCLEFEGNNLTSILTRIAGLRVVRVTQGETYQELDSRTIKLPLDSNLALRRMLVGLSERDEVPHTLLVGVELSRLPVLYTLQKRVGHLLTLCSQELGYTALNIFVVLQGVEGLDDRARERLAVWRHQLQAGFPKFDLHLLELPSISRNWPVDRLATKLSLPVQGAVACEGYTDLSAATVKHFAVHEMIGHGAFSVPQAGSEFALLGPPRAQMDGIAAKIEAATGATVTVVNLDGGNAPDSSLTCDLSQLYDPLTKTQEDFYRKYSIGDLTSAYHYVDDYCFSLLCEFLRSHTKLEPGDRFTRDTLIDELNIAPPLTGYADYFVQLLCEEGMSRCDGGTLTLLESLDSVEDSGILLDKIQSETHLFDGQLRLLRYVISKYPQALSGEIRLSDVLYPDGSERLIREAYQDSIQQLDDELIASIFSSFVEKVLEGVERIRILGVGSDSGMVLRSIAPMLAQLKSVEFYLTDASKTTLVDVREDAVSQGYDFINFGEFDITRPALEQGFDEKSFDLIYAFNAVGSAESIVQATANLESLLVDRGYLCLLERTNARRYVNLIWGMNDGWWQFSHDERDGSPLMPLDRWKRLFKELSFSKTVCYPLDKDLRQRLDRGVIIAQAGVRPIKSAIKGTLPLSGDGKIFDRVFVLDTLLTSHAGGFVSLSNEIPGFHAYQMYSSAVTAWAEKHESRQWCILSDGQRAPGDVNNGRHIAMDLLQQSLGDTCSRVYMPMVTGTSDDRITIDETHVVRIFTALDSALSTVVLEPDKLFMLPVQEEVAQTDKETMDVAVANNGLKEIKTQLIVEMKQLLGIDEISGDDDFFVLGGDSLKVAQLVTSLEKYGYEVKPNEIFNFPKVYQLATYLDRKYSNAELVIETSSQLAAHLAGKFGIEVSTDEVQVDGATRLVLYLDDNTLLSDKVVNRMVGEVQGLRLERDVQPDYVFPLSFRDEGETSFSTDEFFRHFKLEQVTEDSVAELLRYAQLQQRRLCFSIIAEPVELQYAISPFQKMFLKSDTRVLLFQVEFDEVVDQDLLSRAFGDVVRRQGLLRSSLKRSRFGKHKWQQHQLPSKLRVPTVDISGFSEKDQEKIVEEFMAAEYRTDFDAENGIMYHMLLMRKRFNKSTLFFNLDHSIFDNMSGQVLQRQLLDRYKALRAGATVPMPAVKPFNEYLEQISLGPIGLSPEKLIDLFELRSYAESRDRVEKYITANRQSQLSHLQYRLELSRLGIVDNEEATYEATLQLLGYSLARFLDVETVPMKLIYQGRKYHDNSFFDTLGLFVDIVPLLLDIRRSPKDMIKDVYKKLGYLNRYNVTFMNMVLNIPMLMRWRDVVGLTSPKKLPKRDPMLLLNYGGKSGGEYRKIIDFATNNMLQAPGKLDYASFYAIATSEDNHLVLDVICNFESDMDKYKTIIDSVVSELEVSSPISHTVDDESYYPSSAVAIGSLN